MIFAPFFLRGLTSADI